MKWVTIVGYTILFIIHLPVPLLILTAPLRGIESVIPLFTTGNYGCPAGNEACPDALIENFMDYTNDGCMESFYPGTIFKNVSSTRKLLDQG